eukprot:6029178-Pyramimonas_sp.AAC.1
MQDLRTCPKGTAAKDIKVIIGSRARMTAAPTPGTTRPHTCMVRAHPARQGALDPHPSTTWSRTTRATIVAPSARATCTKTSPGTMTR